jgi:hypothetical protein
MSRKSEEAETWSTGLLEDVQRVVYFLQLNSW